MAESKKKNRVVRLGDPVYRRTFELKYLFGQVYIPNKAYLLRHLEAPREDSHVQYELIYNPNSIDYEMKYTAELYRLTYNFLSVRSSTIEIARNLNKKYKVDEYDRITNEFKLTGHNRFLSNLRNYILHYNLPPINYRSTMTIDKDGLSGDYRYILNSEALLRWSGWSKESKKYLKRIQDVDLYDVIRVNSKFFDESIELLTSKLSIDEYVEAIR